VFSFEVCGLEAIQGPGKTVWNNAKQRQKDALTVFRSKTRVVLVSTFEPTGVTEHAAPMMF
jgi:hypothetical protein